MHMSGFLEREAWQWVAMQFDSGVGGQGLSVISTNVKKYGKKGAADNMAHILIVAICLVPCCRLFLWFRMCSRFVGIWTAPRHNGSSRFSRHTPTLVLGGPVLPQQILYLLLQRPLHGGVVLSMVAARWPETLRQRVDVERCSGHVSGAEQSLPRPGGLRFGPLRPTARSGRRGRPGGMSIPDTSVVDRSVLNFP